jgi:hypothetical protein
VTTPNPTPSLETRTIPKDQLEDYFTRFTKHFLMPESTNRIDVEVLSAGFGDQFESEGAHVFGITYDPRKNSLEFALEGGDHRVEKVKEIRTAEEADGFVKAIEVVRDDGTREVARVNRGGITRRAT